MISVVIVGHQEFDLLTGPAIADIRKHEPEVDLVVVDNASPKPYPVGDYGLLRIPNLVSYSVAMNRGYGHAKGDWLVFLNNDIICDGPFAEEIEKLDKNGLYCCGIRRKENWHESGLTFSYPHGWLIVSHRDTFERIGRWDEHYQGAACEDLDIGLRCEELGIPLREHAFPLRHLEQHTRTDIPGWKTQQSQNVKYLIKKWSIKPMEEPKKIELPERIQPDDRGAALYYEIQGHINGRLMMWPVDLAALYSLVNRDGNHLELGCFNGGSAVASALTKIRNGREGLVYTVDVRPSAVMENAKLFMCEDRIRFTQAALPPLPAELDDIEFETCLIDADHIHPAPVWDWLMVKNRIRNLVAFHDLHLLGPKAAFALACADYNWEAQFAQTSSSKAFDVESILRDVDKWRNVGSMGIVERIKHERWVK